ncbi:hypothetical protein OCHUTO_0991 [Orientia chuto str. Dubai]|uniref:Uncharacterized protein n=1 Tax=Orientia chuto str. Dubai TaxID=1359168 RepID=A0A0F3MHE0_9RICK|nr:hypothetical protein OCHUTO_0991 [Orientia chuto str. Dubai]
MFFSFESALASTLENQLDKIGNLSSGKLKVYLVQLFYHRFLL